METDHKRHADLLVDHCTDIGEGDMVVVSAPPVAEELEVALYENIGERGGVPVRIRVGQDRATRSFVRSVEPANLQTPEHLQALVEATDVAIAVQGRQNVSELSDVEPEAMQAFKKIYEPLSEEVLGEETRQVGTQYPAPGDAQRAEMSTDGYAEFVYDAINKDWDAQRAFQEQLVEILDEGSEVRVVAGEGTDLTMSIDGNPAKNDFAEVNLPGGEVFTAPIPDSVEGTVRFDHPVVQMGREVQDASLEFEGGKVIDHDAESNADVLTGLLETDDGARRIGELGIGMNRDIDRFTYNMLFDEKMGDTVHLALGVAYPETVGEGNERNESAVHVDMIVDMSEDSYISVDGEIVQRNGIFVFEEDFDEPDRE